MVGNRTHWLCWALIAYTFSTLILAAQSSLPPFPPVSEADLNSWTLSKPPWKSADDDPAKSFTGLNVAPGWYLNGTALSIDTNVPAFLQLPVYESDWTNIVLTNGSLEVWCQANWSSAADGGTGPGSWATLWNIGSYPISSWLLAITPSGSNLVWMAQSEGNSQVLWTPIDFDSGDWHQIVATWSETNSCLYIDGELATNSGPILYGPSEIVCSLAGFCVGSISASGANAGTNQFHGQLQWLESFSYPLTSNEVAAEFTEIANYISYFGFSAPGGGIGLGGGGGFGDDFPSGGGGGGGSGSESFSNVLPSPTDSITTNYLDYTNFWLAITNNSTQAFVSVMSTLPGLWYEVLTNQSLTTTNWGVYQTVLASNSITPVSALTLNTNQLYFKAALLGYQTTNAYYPGTNTNGAPSIVAQPVAQYVPQGSYASFSVMAVGATPLMCQWEFDGTNIAGATASSYVIPSAQLTNVGSYFAVVSNSVGCVTSTIATLTLSFISFSNFYDPYGLQMNGTCTNATNIDGWVLQLTASAGNQGGSAFLRNAIALTNGASFSTYFAFRLTNGGGQIDLADGIQGADGITFCVQTETSAAYSYGGGLGYYEISNSVAVEFDTWYNFNSTNDPGPIDPYYPTNTTNGDGNHIGIDTNGSIHSTAYQHITTPMNDSNIWYAWIDYNGATSNLQVRLSETNSRPVTANLTDNINLISYLKTNVAYVGFTGATGGSWNEQDVLFWQFNTSYEPIGENLTVAFTTPTNDQLFVYSPTNIYLTALVSNSPGTTVSSVVFSNQFGLIGTGAFLSNSLYQTLWQLVTNGTYDLTVTATDSSQNVATSSIEITVNAMPTISITNPTPLQSFQEVTNITITAVASKTNGTVTNITFFTNFPSPSNILAMISTNASNVICSAVWSNLTAGNYPVVAVATDNRGAQTMSQIEVFTVTNPCPSPVVQILYPTNGSAYVPDCSLTITALAYGTNCGTTNAIAPVTNVEFFTQASHRKLEKCAGLMI